MSKSSTQQEVDFSQIDYSAVDYASHPAYRNLDAPAATEQQIVGEILHNIENCVSGIHESPRLLSQDDITRRFENEIDPQLQNLSDYFGSHCQLSDAYLQHARQGVELARENLYAEVVMRNDRHQYRAVPWSASRSEQIAYDLAVDGIAARSLPRQEIQNIFESVAPYRKQLEERRDMAPESYCNMSLPLVGSYWSQLQSIVRRNGFLRGTSDYVRHNLELIYCALVLSHEGEEWWKGCYEEDGIATSKTVYMHNDEGHHVYKMIIYLNDVSDDQGPFSFVKGSSNRHRSIAQNWIIKGIDVAVVKSLQRTPGDFYYRTRFKDPAHRRQLLALPSLLQGTSHFGDDVVDDSPLSRFLLNHETRYVSERANCMVFNGCYGVHRGAYVERGERWALQLGLAKKPAFSVRRSLRRLEQSVRIPLKRFLRIPSKQSRKAA